MFTYLGDIVACANWPAQGLASSLVKSSLETAVTEHNVVTTLKHSAHKQVTDYSSPRYDDVLVDVGVAS